MNPSTHLTDSNSQIVPIPAGPARQSGVRPEVSPRGAYLPQSRSQFIAWLRGRQASARTFAQSLVGCEVARSRHRFTHGSCEHLFWRRALEFACSNKPILTVQPAEIWAIANRYDSDSERLAALEALAHPRLAYEWLQAGGSLKQNFTDVTEADLAEARDYYGDQGRTQYARKV